MSNTESYLHREAKDLLYSEIKSKQGFGWKISKESGFERLNQEDKVYTEYLTEYLTSNRNTVIIHDIAAVLNKRISWAIEIINKHYPNWIGKANLNYPIYIIKADNIMKRVSSTPVYVEDIITGGRHKNLPLRKVIEHGIDGRKIVYGEISSKRDERKPLEILYDLYEKNTGNWQQFEHPLNHWSRILDIPKPKLKELILLNIRKRRLEELKEIIETEGLARALEIAQYETVHGQDPELKELFIAQVLSEEQKAQL